MNEKEERKKEDNNNTTEKKSSLKTSNQNVKEQNSSKKEENEKVKEEKKQEDDNQKPKSIIKDNNSKKIDLKASVNDPKEKGEQKDTETENMNTLTNNFNTLSNNIIHEEEKEILENKELETDKNKLYNELEKQFEEYTKNKREIYPGSKITKDLYCKIISLIQSNNYYLKTPEDQLHNMDQIVKDFFSKEDIIPKLFKLYPDVLQYKLMKDLEYRNSTEKVKEDLINFYMRKYFRLNNIREKILTKSNQILNFKDFNEKFQVNKDYKIGKINTEIEFTMKRIIRLLNIEINREKDFEYYLEHFKVRRIDTIFLKKEQNEMHYNLRKDDFDVYFRENIYKSKVQLHVKTFKSFISYCPIKSGFEIWKNSKKFLNNMFKKSWENIIKNIKIIYSNEKQRCTPADLKLFKDYFRNKYEFYYKLNDNMEDDKKQYNFTYDIYYPPLVITINSEIRPYLKELCEYFETKINTAIDKGKGFSYLINKFYKEIFDDQSKNFQFNAYELTFNEFQFSEIKVGNKDANKKNNENDNDNIELEVKPTEVLRNKYNIKDGFLVNNDTLKHTSFKSSVYIKTSFWAKFICVFPDINLKYQNQMRVLNDIGYVDSNFKYILGMIEKCDLNTLNRLIDDYTMDISTKIKNTIKLISSKKEEDNYSQLRDLIKEIIQNDEMEKGTNTKTKGNGLLNPHDEYTDKVDNDLLKQLMTLRFLKLRDYKFYLLNLLNYFRYIQKKLVIDTYKIENKNWKKNIDLNNLTDQLTGTMKNTMDNQKPKTLIINQPLSEFSKTNPIIPSLEIILESKLNEEEFNKSYFEEIDEMVEYSDKLIRIKDNKGKYIIYEATLSDMKQLEEEFCKIGTYYIQKKEKLIVDTDKVPNPFIDRTQVILDLFLNEFDYLYAKFEYISELMTIYDNTTDIFKQKKLIKLITNIMAQRPILELDYNYFTASYMVEIEILRKKAAFMHILIDYQKKMEINENRLLYDSIDKYYWLLGEIALEIIQHARLDKNDIETYKQMLGLKKDEFNNLGTQEKDSVNEIEKFINLFTKLKQEKDIEADVNLSNLKNDSGDEEKADKSSSRQSEKHLNFEDDSDDNESQNLNNDGISPLKKKTKLKEFQKTKSIKKNNNELTKKLNVLLKYLKRLFSIALTGGDENFLDNDTDELVKSKDEVIESVKNSLYSIIDSFDDEKKKNVKNNNKSYSISNASLDALNYEIRSLLNIPNPYNENQHLEYIEKNPTVVNSLNKDINFIKFEEGFPHKYIEQEDSSLKGTEIEFFESLSCIVNAFELIDDVKKNLNELFVSPNDISRNGLEVSIIDYLIEEWENFKDYITGRKNSDEYNKLYYLQNTIIDNYHSYLFSIKNLSALLCNPTRRIPPQLLANLPNKVVEKIKFETEFVLMTKPQEANKIENLINNDLNISLELAIQKSLVNTLTENYKSGWVKYQTNFDEISIYCNMLEQFRMKKTIFSLIARNTFLSIIYEKQKTDFLNTSKEMIYYKEDLGIRPPFYNNNTYTKKRNKEDNRIVFYVDRYYYYNDDEYYKMYNKDNETNQIPKFAIEEFDPSLVTCAYFNDLITIQSNMFEKGINELKTFATYEYLNFFLLLIGTQHNFLLFFEPEKYLTELNLFEDDKIVLKNSIFNYQSVINNPDKNKTEKAILHEMSNRIKDIEQKLAKRYFYSLIDKKQKNRGHVLKDKYDSFLNERLKIYKKPKVMKLIAARHERLLLCNAYCQDIFMDVFIDSIKLQACRFSNILKTLIKTIPKEYNVFEVNDNNFLENEKLIKDEFTLSNNFRYFKDRYEVFKQFYVASNLEILNVDNFNDQNDTDKKLYLYQKFNPFDFTDEIWTNQFYPQFKQNFYKSPTQCNIIENGINKFFNECFSYQSNALYYLQFCVFFINFINLKYIDICLTQKPADIAQINTKVENGQDFWGDKKTNVFQVPKNTKRLPLDIVEKIVETEKNYLNFRMNFDRFKIDLDKIMNNIKRYLDKPTEVLTYMNNYINFKIYHWYHIFNIAREICLKKDDLPSFQFLTAILKNNFIYGRRDYFKETDCKFQCHLVDDSKYYINDLYYKHMNFEDSSIALYKLNNFDYFPNYKRFSLLNGNKLLFYNDIKLYFPFITENKIAEVRNLNFKITSMTKNYLIYREKSELNSELYELDQMKIDFLIKYIKLTEFKYKFIILIKNGLIKLNGKLFMNIENSLNEERPKIDCKWIENSSISDPNEPEILGLNDNKQDKKKNKGANNSSSPSNLRRKSQDNVDKNKNSKENKFESPKKDKENKIESPKKDKNKDQDDKSLFDNKKENNLKMNITRIVEAFITGTRTTLTSFVYKVYFIMIDKGIYTFSKENNALKQLFTSLRNDLDINCFRNKFSSNFLKELDDNQIISVCSKFPFFENFINTINNISEEVSTRAESSAMLIKKSEFEETVQKMINDFIIFDSNLQRENHFSYSKEKFSYYFCIRKLEIWLKAYVDKLKQFDNDLEKISNAKTALTNNTLVYEMDNLYRQLKVLKDNIKIMELYIGEYFADKNNDKILEYELKIEELKAQFTKFRNELVNSTNQKITEGYVDCINQLKEKTTDMREKSNKISHVDETEDKEFFITFKRNLDINENHYKDLCEEKKKIHQLQKDIENLHSDYRLKIHNQKLEYEKELDKLNNNLSSNQDLWDKLLMVEGNEKILKEELAKTQRSLASAEEFIKRLRIQIRISHDRNVELEKEKAMVRARENISNAGKGINFKAKELYSEIRQTYVYNMKNNVNIITALERIKARYGNDEDIALILNNFEMLQQKYGQEVDNKRTFSNTLKNIRNDIEKMQAIHNKKVDDMTSDNNKLKDENANLKLEIEKLKYNKISNLSNNNNTNNNSRKYMNTNTNSSNASLRISNNKFPEIKIVNNNK